MDTDSATSDINIKVAVRIRPLLQKEDQNSLWTEWKVHSNTIQQKSTNAAPYVFDSVFGQDSNNCFLHEELCMPIIQSAMQGFHGTIFAYGQSGSGKTHTMSGSKLELGIINLAMKEIFSIIDQSPSREYLLRLSYIEIYNEKLFDLLSNEEKTLRIQEDTDRQVNVIGVEEKVVHSVEDIQGVIQQGDNRRRFAETKQNDRSSRSHCIIRMVIESRERGDENAVIVSHLNFVDLAGSERAGDNSGDRLREGCAINRSLLTLGQIIAKLSDGGSNQHIGYRDSKLTRILQNALGGNSKTVIICTISPTSIEESHSTLRFASRAKTIKNKPIVNEVLSETALLKKYQLEIAKLQKKLTQMNVDTNQTDVNTIQMEKADLEKQLEEKERVQREHEELINRLRSMVCVASTISGSQDSQPPKRKQRRETWCGPKLSRRSHVMGDLVLPCRLNLTSLNSMVLPEVSEEDGENDLPLVTRRSQDMVNSTLNETPGLPNTLDLQLAMENKTLESQLQETQAVVAHLQKELAEKTELTDFLNMEKICLDETIHNLSQKNRAQEENSVKLLDYVERLERELSQTHDSLKEVTAAHRSQGTEISQLKQKLSKERSSVDAKVKVNDDYITMLERQVEQSCLKVSELEKKLAAVSALPPPAKKDEITETPAAAETAVALDESVTMTQFSRGLLLADELVSSRLSGPGRAAEPVSLADELMTAQLRETEVPTPTGELMTTGVTFRRSGKTPRTPVQSEMAAAETRSLAEEMAFAELTSQEAGGRMEPLSAPEEPMSSATSLELEKPAAVSVHAELTLTKQTELGEGVSREDEVMEGKVLSVDSSTPCDEQETQRCLQEMTERCRSLEEELGRCREELAASTEKAASLSALHSDLEEQLERSRADLMAANSRSQQLEQDLLELSQQRGPDVQALLSERHHLEQQLRKLAAEKSQIEKQLSPSGPLGVRLDQVTRDCDDLTSLVQTLTKENMELKTQVEELQSERTGQRKVSQTQVEQWEEDLACKETQLQEVEERLTAQQAHMELHRQEQETAEPNLLNSDVRLKETEIRLKELEEELARKQAHIDLLMQEQENGKANLVDGENSHPTETEVRLKKVEEELAKKQALVEILMQEQENRKANLVDGEENTHLTETEIRLKEVQEELAKKQALVEELMQEQENGKQNLVDGENSCLTETEVRLKEMEEELAKKQTLVEELMQEQENGKANLVDGEEKTHLTETEVKLKEVEEELAKKQALVEILMQEQENGKANLIDGEENSYLRETEVRLKEVEEELAKKQALVEMLMQEQETGKPNLVDGEENTLLTETEIRLKEVQEELARKQALVEELMQEQENGKANLIDGEEKTHLTETESRLKEVEEELAKKQALVEMLTQEQENGKANLEDGEENTHLAETEMRLKEVEEELARKQALVEELLQSKETGEMSTEGAEKHLKEENTDVEELLSVLEDGKVRQEELEVRLKEREIRIAALELTLEESHADAEKLILDVSEKETQLEELLSSLADSKEEIEQLSKTVEQLQLEVLLGREEAARLSEELKEKTAELDDLQSALEGEESEIGRLTKEAEETQAQVDELRETLKSSQTRQEEVSAELQSSQVRVRQLEAEKVLSWTTHSDSESGEVEDLKDALQASQSQVEQLQNQLEAQCHLHKELESALKDSCSQRDQLETALKESQGCRETLDSALREARNQCQELERALEKSRKQQEDLECSSKESGNWQELEAKLKDSQGRQELLENALTESRCQREQLENTLVDSRSQQEELEAKLKDSQNQQEQLENALAESCCQREELEAKLKDGQNHPEQLQNTLAESRSQREELEARLKDSLNQQEQLENALAESRSQQEELENTLAESHCWREEVEKVLGETQDQRDSLEAMLEDSKSRQESLQAALEESQRRQEEVEKELEVRDAKIAELTAYVEQKKAAVTARLEDLEQELTAKQDLLDEIAEENANLWEKLEAQNQLTDNRESLESKISELQTQLQEALEASGHHAEEATTARTLLETASKEADALRQRLQELEQQLAATKEATEELSVEPTPSRQPQEQRALNDGASCEQLKEAILRHKASYASAKLTIRQLEKRLERMKSMFLSEEGQNMQESQNEEIKQLKAELQTKTGELEELEKHKNQMNLDLHHARHQLRTQTQDAQKKLRSTEGTVEYQRETIRRLKNEIRRVQESGSLEHSMQMRVPPLPPSLDSTPAKPDTPVFSASIASSRSGAVDNFMACVLEAENKRLTRENKKLKTAMENLQTSKDAYDHTVAPSASIRSTVMPGDEVPSSKVSGSDPRPSGCDPRPSGSDPRPSGSDPQPSGSVGSASPGYAGGVIPTPSKVKAMAEAFERRASSNQAASPLTDKLQNEVQSPSLEPYFWQKKPEPISRTTPNFQLPNVGQHRAAKKNVGLLENLSPSKDPSRCAQQ